MRLLICDDATQADRISRDMLKLWRGRDNRPGEITTHLFEIVRHPSNGTVALKLPDGLARPVSKRWARVQDMPTGELVKVADTEAKMRGEITKGAVSSDALAALAAGNRVLTKAQAAAAGWFPDEAA